MEERSIGKEIARARHRKRWTQEELARVLGVSRPTVADWETGKHFPQRNLGAIEEALDISLDGYEPEAAAS
jgi:transcriptional regulator with XRE-family HTH domain